MTDRRQLKVELRKLGVPAPWWLSTERLEVRLICARAALLAHENEAQREISNVLDS